MTIDVEETRPYAFELPPKECQKISDALADVLCWFAGFKAASKEYAELPPGLNTLRNFNATLKDYFE